MITLDQKAEILLKYFRENKSQRAISKELGISRTTVQKYIKEFQSKNERLQELAKGEERNKAEILLLIEEMASKPKYDTSNRKKVKLTDEVMEEIDKLILLNERNKELGRAKQLMKKIDVHEALIDKGYDIGYTTVCNYIKETYEQKEAYVRQEYTLGEVLEFDWGEVKLTINGKNTTLNMGLL
ncbi:helix-turn-helix domain-containing protein [Tepidimicrobium xylanilyticum]